MNAALGTPEPLRILVVEDHPIFLKGLISLLNLQAGLLVVAEAQDRAGALQTLERIHPDLALIDLSLGKDNGLDLIKDILYRAPTTKILVLSMYDEAIYERRALAAGALGFCNKNEDLNLLLQAIRAVGAGNPWVAAKPRSIEPARRVINQQSLETLSDRELEVLQLVGIGLGPTEIAGRLKISVKTVDTYKANLKTKLDCSRAHELRQIAIEWMGRQNRI